MTVSPNRIIAVATVAAALVLSAAATAQESAPPLSLSGTYRVTHPSSGGSAVRMTFDATITNNGAADVKGPIVLRHPNDIGKVYARFGEKAITAGKSVTVHATVSVPRDQYKSWASAGPAVFFYTQNDRGDIKTYRISMSALPTAKS